MVNQRYHERTGNKALQRNATLTSKINDWMRFGMYFTGSRGNRQEAVDSGCLSVDDFTSTDICPGCRTTGVKRYTSKAFTFESNNKNMVCVETENFKSMSIPMSMRRPVEINPIRLSAGTKNYTLQTAACKDWGGTSDTGFTIITTVFRTVPWIQTVRWSHDQYVGQQFLL